jgi:isocitrate/isopropylmalate dehydrogenase
VKTYRIASIPGDGIGNEVIPAGIEVLEKAADGFRLEFEHFDWSSRRFNETGRYIPDGGLDKLKRFDAIFFGAVGAPDVADHLSLWGLRLPICQGFDQYANVRPARVLPGIRSPLDKGKDIDWVIVRENTEGEYSGAAGAKRNETRSATAHTSSGRSTRSSLSSILRRLCACFVFWPAMFLRMKSCVLSMNACWRSATARSRARSSSRSTAYSE